LVNEREDLFRKMTLARRAEERIRKEYFRDEMKTPVHLGIGGEAIAIGVLHALQPPYSVFGTYRNHNLFLALSGDTDSFFAELYGKAAGCAKGKAGSMHLSCPEHGLLMTSAVVSTTIPVAVGAALANRYRRQASPVAVFFGDGAVEEGVFWESLNFSALHRLNVLFVCEDNDLAIHTFKKERQALRSLGDAVRAFGCRYFQGDGRDVEEVLRVARAGIAAMRAEPGPVVLSFDYFRFLQHVGPLADFDAGYRSEPDQLTERHDPVLRYRSLLAAAGVAEPTLLQIEREIDRQIDDSILLAKNAEFAGPEELCRDVYGDGAGEVGGV
jgi:TPP-dependent pyruvate/acetoin dehydrogenase alpha subunit